MRLVLFSEGEIENQFPGEMLAVQRTARGFGYLSRAGLWLGESTRILPNTMPLFRKINRKMLRKYRVLDMREYNGLCRNFLVLDSSNLHFSC